MDKNALLVAMVLAADPYVRPLPKRSTFVPDHPDYADYPEGRHVRLTLPSGALPCTVAGVTHGLLKLSCKPLSRVREGQALSISGDTFRVERVALASLVLRPEARPR